MPEVSTVRLYLLRLVYLIISCGLAVVVWPGVLHHDQPWTLSTGVVRCMLTAFSLLCILGLRYPLQMLPVLMWELLWKVIWMLAIALPAWRSGQIDEATISTLYECAGVIIIPLAMPWRYVYARYLQQPGDRWKPLRA
ncbi:hypothetical protein GTP23_10805 [Pseudoduganella sp. FT93W]|uniref:Uncharacterized protein n=1 Tax=Duganella fentianensis TaxID=2692177 RepID=A0A845I337_9BURK|nr:hypothetical protein [Duganella fentianensis]MYN45536.1 hypothetical protein [Duganella fentianensis]